METSPISFNYTGLGIWISLKGFDASDDFGASRFDKHSG
jgi:hypothetical protein